MTIVCLFHAFSFVYFINDNDSTYLTEIENKNKIVNNKHYWITKTQNTRHNNRTRLEIVWNLCRHRPVQILYRNCTIVQLAIFWSKIFVWQNGKTKEKDRKGKNRENLFLLEIDEKQKQRHEVFQSLAMRASIS